MAEKTELNRLRLPTEKWKIAAMISASARAKAMWAIVFALGTFALSWIFLKSIGCASSELPAVEACRKTHGWWIWGIGEKKANGECIYKTMDAGKVCDDDSQCESYYCVNFDCKNAVACEQAKGKCLEHTRTRFVIGCERHYVNGHYELGSCADPVAGQGLKFDPEKQPADWGVKPSH